MSDGVFDNDSVPSEPVGKAGGGGFMAGIGKMRDSADRMIESARSGGFRSSPEGVKPLIDACSRMIDRIEELRENFSRLAQDPKLGSSPYALRVAKHDRQSADGPQGAVPQLLALRETLVALTEALYRASSQYAEAEEAATMRGSARNDLMTARQGFSS
ncbi:P-loop NTPase family protein [Saccharomonospora iraqiensis]|uniref:hypothetical protein n=1 Tax=Saccharomonospora iraqiensis TaxID=52698 RepID=UPI0006990F2C|nr:hypothetical protein [Saccharomonospora iraqiensis]